MVELEETFITQLQRVADTYKREMQEQHSIRSDTEVRLRAAQLAVHQADTQREEAQAALHALQVGITAADRNIYISPEHQLVMQSVAEWNPINLEPILDAAVTSYYYSVLSYMLSCVSHGGGTLGGSRQHDCVLRVSQRLLAALQMAPGFRWRFGICTDIACCPMMRHCPTNTRVGILFAQQDHLEVLNYMIDCLGS